MSIAFGAFWRRYPHLIGGLLGATLLLAGQAGVDWWANRTAAKNAAVAKSATFLDFKQAGEKAGLAAAEQLRDTAREILRARPVHIEFTMDVQYAEEQR